MSPEQGNIVSAHIREENSIAKLAETQPYGTQSAQENNESIKEPSIVPYVANTKEITKVQKVVKEPPQVDPSTTWKIFVEGAKNSLGAGIGVVLKSSEGAIF